MSHLLQFSVILLVVMLGFCVSLYTLFSECQVDGSDGGEDRAMFDSFDDTILIMFDAMLGNIDFMMLEGKGIYCPGPDWATDLGVMLLAVYMVVMAITLLNLLIAVLSAAHAEVHAKIEEEFQLARTKIIHKTGIAVAQVSRTCLSHRTTLERTASPLDQSRLNWDNERTVGNLDRQVRDCYASLGAMGLLMLQLLD